MATIRKRNGRYHVQVRRRGRRSINHTFDRLTAARAWVNQVGRDMEAVTCRKQTQHITIAALLTRYQEEVLPLLKGSKTEAYRIKTLTQLLGAHFLNDFKASDVAGYRDQRLKTVSAASVLRELGILRRTLNLAAKEWDIPLPSGNLVQQITLPRTDPARKRRLQGSEAECLLANTSNTPLGAAINLALETAMRRSELLSIRKSDIDLNLSTVSIKSTKNGEERIVPLSSTARAVFKKLIDKQVASHIVPIHRGLIAYTPRGLSGEFLKLCRRLGIEDLRFHDLRHEATSRLFEKGLNPVEVASITGHKDTRMLMRYTHLRADVLAKKLG
jgi:integrase